MTALAPDTWVVVAGQLGRVVRESRIGNAHGYDVTVPPETFLEGYAPHFAEARSVEPAVVGVNVCRKPRGQCFCGYLHAPHPEWLPSADQSAARLTSQTTKEAA